MMPSELEFKLQQFRGEAQKLFMGDKLVTRIEPWQAELMYEIIRALELEYFNMKSLSER